MAEEKQIGRITHFYAGIGVAVIELNDALKVGDNIHVKGSTTDFTQKIESMQIEHKNIKAAKKGESIGLKMAEKVREGDIVYKVS